MRNRILSLIWLRWHYLLKNKMILFVCVLTPILDFFLLQLLPNVHGETFFLGTALSMVYSVTAGTLTSIMVSEEKEKRLLRTFIVSGVKGYEYFISIVLFPFLFSSLSCFILPFAFGITFKKFFIYILIVLLTSLSFILINFLIGLFAKTQNQDSLYSLLFFIIATFLPMFMEQSTLVSNVVKFSFFGANSEFLYQLSNYSLNDVAFLSLMIWNILLVLLVHRLFKWNQNL